MLWLLLGLVVGFVIGFALGYDEMEKKVRRKVKAMFDSKNTGFFNDDHGYVDSEYFNKNIFGE